MMAAMDGAGNGGHVLEVVIAAPPVAGAHAVALAEDLPGTALAIREEGRLVIDVAALTACATPRAYGRALGEALWQGSTLGAWQRARARGRERLHVVLEVLAPELRSLRWERLCAPFDTDWDFLRCDQRTPFTLRVASQSDRAYAAPDEPRALVLVTSPSDLADYGLASFDTLATIEGVRAALSPWPVDVLAFSVPGAVGPPTLEGLCAQLTAQAYAAVHVVCHGAYARGGGETVLYLADDDETTAPAPASKIIKRIGRLGGDVGLPLLWFLAACESAAPEAEGALGGLSARLCRELGAPAVIAMSDRVTIDTAGELVRPFYRQLRVHGHVDLALGEACSAVAERSDLVVPVLHARSAGSPVFPVRRTSGQVAKDMSRETDAMVWSESPLPLALGERFVGRPGLLAELAARLTARTATAVALVAPGGLGKTRVALELIGQHRARFPGGVVWLDASTLDRREAVQHALLRQIQPDAPSLAELQRQGVTVAARLAEAARAHRPGQVQLWVLDHLPEEAIGEALLATWCPRWGEVAVLVTSRMRPDTEGMQVLELEGLRETEGAALLVAGLPAGSMSAEDAAMVVRWVGGMPLALELLARSLDLGDLSPAEVVAQARTGRVAQALTETQQVLRSAGAGAGLSPLIDSLRLSYARLPADAQALARRIAQFGPEPLPTALVKGLGPVASRSARATLAARSFVTGISGQRFGSMHRVLADFLRGLCGRDEPIEACAALLRELPFDSLGAPERWPEFTAAAVHAEALLLRAEVVTEELIELGNAVGFLYQAQTRYVEAERVQRHVLTLAEANLPPESTPRIGAVNNLAMTMMTQGDAMAGLQVQAELLTAASGRLGPDDNVVLLLRNNYAVSLQGVGQMQGSHDILVDVVARRQRLGETDTPSLLSAMTSLAAAKAALGDLSGARALHEKAYGTWLAGRGRRDPSTVTAATGLILVMHQQGELAAAMALLATTMADARALWGPDHLGLIELREVDAMLVAEAGDAAAAEAEMVEVFAALTRLCGPDSQRTLHAAGLLGRMLLERGAFAEARALQEPALMRALQRHGVAHAGTRVLLDQLCDVLDAQGEYAAARDLLARGLEQMRTQVGPDHPEVVRWTIRCATMLARLQAYDQAHALLADIHATLVASRGPRDIDALMVVDHMARFRLWAGDLAGARPILEHVLEDSRAALGADHFDSLRRAGLLGQTLGWMGAFAEALPLLQEAALGLSRVLGPGHVETLGTQIELGCAYLGLGALAEAEPLLTGSLAGLTGRLLAGHTQLMHVRVALARLRRQQGRLDEAASLLAVVLPSLAPRHQAVFTAGAFAGLEVATALYAAGRAADGLALQRVAVPMLVTAFGADDTNVLASELNLAVMLAKTGDVAGGLAVIDKVDAGIARAGGAAHPLATTAAERRASLAALRV